MKEDWKKSFNILMLAEFIAIAGFATSTPIVPLYLKEIGVSDPAALNWWTGLITSSSSLALAVFAPIWGSLADSYGRKLMLLRAMIGGCVLMGLLSLANSPWQILLLRTLQGCVTGTVAAATVMTASIVPQKEVGYRLGLLQMAVFLGNSVGPLFGGVITDYLGSRVNFLATSVLLAAAALLVARGVTEKFEPKPRTGSILKNAVPDFSIIAKNSSLASLFLVIFAVQLASAVVAPILPLIVMDMRGADATGVGSLSGLIIGASSIAGAIAAALIGKVSMRVGYGRTLFICIMGALAFYLPQGFVRTPYELLALRIGSGIFLGGTMPSVNALIASLCDKNKQGSTYGLSSSVSSMGMAVGPALGALVANAAGYPAVFFTTSAVLGLTGIAVGKAVRVKKAKAIEALVESASNGTKP